MWFRKRRPRPTHELVGPAFASAGAVAFGMVSGSFLNLGVVSVGVTFAAYVLICLAYVAGERSV